MRAGKIVAIVLGAILVLIGLGLIAPGGFLLWAYGTQRDSTGYFETSSRILSTSTHALTTPDGNLELVSGLGNWVPRGETAAVRIRATSTGNTALFVGIGPTELVSEYLSGVGHEEVTDFGWLSSSVDYRRFPGGAPSSPPGEQDFWVAKQEGAGVQTLEWEVRDGNWTAVIMNADGVAPVTASVSLGARFGLVLPIGIGILAAGVVLLAIGIALIVLGARRPRLKHEYQPAVVSAGTWPETPQPPQGVQSPQPTETAQTPAAAPPVVPPPQPPSDTSSPTEPRASSKE
jgi:uncharacterized membrane protein